MVTQVKQQVLLLLRGKDATSDFDDLGSVCLAYGHTGQTMGDVVVGTGER